MTKFILYIIFGSILLIHEVNPGSVINYPGCFSFSQWNLKSSPHATLVLLLKASTGIYKCDHVYLCETFQYPQLTN